MKYFIGLITTILFSSLFVVNCSVDNGTSVDSTSDSTASIDTVYVHDTVSLIDTLSRIDTVIDTTTFVDFDSSKANIDQSFLRSDTNWSDNGITFYYDQYILDGPYVRYYTKSKKSSYIDRGQGTYFTDTLKSYNVFVSEINKNVVSHTIYDNREYKTVTAFLIGDTSGNTAIAKNYTDTNWTFASNHYEFPHQCLNDVFSLDEGYHKWVFDTLSGSHAYLLNSAGDVDPNDSTFEQVPISTVYDTTKFYAKSNKGYFCLSYGYVRDTLKIYNRLNYMLVSKDNLGLIGHWEGNYTYKNDYLTDLDNVGESNKIDQTMTKEIKIAINEKDSGTIEMYYNGWRIPHNIYVDKNSKIIYSVNTGDALFKYRLIENRLLEIEEIVEYGKEAFNEF